MPRARKTVGSFCREGVKQRVVGRRYRSPKISLARSTPCRWCDKPVDLVK